MYSLITCILRYEKKYWINESISIAFTLLRCVFHTKSNKVDTDKCTSFIILKFNAHMKRDSCYDKSKIIILQTIIHCLKLFSRLFPLTKVGVLVLIWLYLAGIWFIFIFIIFLFIFFYDFFFSEKLKIQHLNTAWVLQDDFSYDYIKFKTKFYLLFIIRILHNHVFAIWSLKQLFLHITESVLGVTKHLFCLRRSKSCIPTLLPNNDICYWITHSLSTISSRDQLCVPLRHDTVKSSNWIGFCTFQISITFLLLFKRCPVMTFFMIHCCALSGMNLCLCSNKCLIRFDLFIQQ